MRLTYQQLMDEVSRLIESKSSGTLFIRSDCNHSITIALESGQISALYFGPRKGRKAIPLTLAISGGSCRFDPNGLTREPQDLPSTQQVMALLQSKEVASTTMSKSIAEQSDVSWSEEVQQKIFTELQGVLTDHLGPIAGIIFEESLAELTEPCVSEARFQLLIDKLALDMEAGQVSRFRDQVADILSKNS